MKRETRNISVLVVGESLWGLQSAMIFPATVLAVLLAQFGAGEKMIGSIDAVNYGGIVLPQIIGIYLFRSRKKRKQNLILWHFFFMLPFAILMGFVILFSHRFSAFSVRWALLLLSLFYVLTIGIILPVWLDWIASIFKKENRGTAMGLSWAFSAGLGTVGGLLSGYLIRKNPGTEIYAWLYFAATVIMGLSILTFYFMDDSEAAQIEESDFSTGKLLGNFRKSLQGKNFRSFLYGRLLCRAGFCILPFLAVYYSSAEGGALNTGTVVSCGSAQTLGMALGCLVLGKLGDLRGHRLGLIIGTCSHFTALLVLIFSGGVSSCIAAYFAVGLGFSADITSHANMVFETCPHEDRMAHITISNLIMAIGAIIFPIVAGAIANAWGHKFLFSLSAVIIILALLWMIFKVREPRTIQGLN